MMREAQKMMQDPAFQAHMDKVMKSSNFKQAMKKTEEHLKDPKKAKELEEKTKAAIQEGNKLLDEREKALKEATGEDGDKKTDEKEDKKVAAEEIDDVPDIPSLNIN